MKKGTMVFAALMTAALNLSAGELENIWSAAGGFGTLPRIAGQADNYKEPITPARAQEEQKAALSPKIYVTPVTAHWADVMLVKFNKGTDIQTVMNVLKEAGLSSNAYADNGNGFFVRVDIKDDETPRKAVFLAGYAVMDGVEVNENVYRALKGDKSVATEAVFRHP